jgi:hypothetical protein
MGYASATDPKFLGTLERWLRSLPEILVLICYSAAAGSKDFNWVGGETHAELREALEDSRGVPVAVGPYPPWLVDTDDVVSAIVPDENGIVRCGVY